MSVGISIHIGMNNVDPDAYAGWDGSLDAPENDAEAMSELMHELSYRSRTLKSQDATSDAVFATIRRAADSLDAGDICVITYAGHGGQFADLGSNEADGMDETWLLYDREVLDDEIHAELAAFRTGVRVVVVSDSCHSGTVTREFYRRALTDSSEVRAAYAHVAPRLRSRSRAASRPVRALKLRGAPADVQTNVLAEHRAEYARIRAQTPHRAAVRSQATLLLLAACQDNQAALEYDGHGVYTAALLDRWDDGSFEGSYRTMHGAIRTDLPPTQTPNLVIDGQAWPAFENQKPFTIAAPGDAPPVSVPDPDESHVPPARTASYRLEVAVEGDVQNLPDSVRRMILGSLAADPGAGRSRTHDDPTVDI